MWDILICVLALMLMIGGTLLVTASLIALISLGIRSLRDTTFPFEVVLIVFTFASLGMVLMKASLLLCPSYVSVAKILLVAFSAFYVLKWAIGKSKNPAISDCGIMDTNLTDGDDCKSRDDT